MAKTVHVKGSIRPKEVEVVATNVYVASNIEYYEETIEGHTMSGYEYDYTIYSYAEYMEKITSDSNAKITALEEELQATKILLGVE